jgi:hypothetical protein
MVIGCACQRGAGLGDTGIQRSLIAQRRVEAASRSRSARNRSVVVISGLLWHHRNYIRHFRSIKLSTATSLKLDEDHYSIAYPNPSDATISHLEYQPGETHIGWATSSEDTVNISVEDSSDQGLTPAEAHRSRGAGGTRRSSAGYDGTIHYCKCPTACFTVLSFWWVGRGRRVLNCPSEFEPCLHAGFPVAGVCRKLPDVLGAHARQSHCFAV